VFWLLLFSSVINIVFKGDKLCVVKRFIDHKGESFAFFPRCRAINYSTRRHRNHLQSKMTDYTPLLDEVSVGFSDCATSSDTNESIFHCLYPSNLRMRTVGKRAETFQSPFWLKEKLLASPRELASARFYYLGKENKVWCWYCGEGLENWKKYDTPWYQHAKWFSRCEFLRTSKTRRRFFDRYAHKLPEINQTKIEKCDLFRPCPQMRKYLKNKIPFVDPREKINRREEKIAKEMNSENVKFAKSLGFEEDNKINKCSPNNTKTTIVIYHLLRFYRSVDGFLRRYPQVKNPRAINCRRRKKNFARRRHMSKIFSRR